MGADELIRWITRAKPLIMARWGDWHRPAEDHLHSSMIKKGREQYRLSDWSFGIVLVSSGTGLGYSRAKESLGRDREDLRKESLEKLGP